MDEYVELLVGAGLTGIAAKLRDISLEEAMDDYEKLSNTLCKDINERSLVGSKAMDYFFLGHRLRTKVARGISFPEWLKTDEYKKPYYKRFIKKATDSGMTLIKAKYAAFTLYSGSGTIKAFKPIIARKLYCMFDPTTILDFSAGWGGRCLGAMSLDKNYIGFDTNKTLKPAYARMIRSYPTDGEISIHFQDSAKVDYSRYDYDMVFTSPPYFKATKPTERYEQMPEYKDRDDFNKRFLFPVITNTYKHLKTGGTYALNLPADMYEDVKKILGASSSKIQLELRKRSNIKSQGGDYKEYIYVWKKSNVRGGKRRENLPAPTWKHPMLISKKSTIPNAGRGVFATKDIPKGTRLAEYNGIQMTRKAFNEKYPDDQRYYYSLRNNVLDGHNFKTENISHYINEGDVANVELKKRALYAKKAIQKGEELFLKYPKNYQRTY